MKMNPSITSRLKSRGINKGHTEPPLFIRTIQRSNSIFLSQSLKGRGTVLRRECMKFIAVLVTLMFVLSIAHPLESAEIVIKIPFGHGSRPKKQSIIDKLKNEETEGAGTAIALIILGACIVAAAVIIVNKAEDIKDDVEDKYDSEKQDLQDQYEQEKEELEDRYNDEQEQEPASEPAPE